MMIAHAEGAHYRQDDLLPRHHHPVDTLCQHMIPGRSDVQYVPADSIERTRSMSGPLQARQNAATSSSCCIVLPLSRAMAVPDSLLDIIGRVCEVSISI